MPIIKFAYYSLTSSRQFLSELLIVRECNVVLRCSERIESDVSSIKELRRLTSKSDGLHKLLLSCRCGSSPLFPRSFVSCFTIVLTLSILSLTSCLCLFLLSSGKGDLAPCFALPSKYSKGTRDLRGGKLPSNGDLGGGHSWYK